MQAQIQARLPPVGLHWIPQITERGSIESIQSLPGVLPFECPRMFLQEEINPYALTTITHSKVLGSLASSQMQDSLMSPMAYWLTYLVVKTFFLGGGELNFFSSLILAVLGLRCDLGLSCPRACGIFTLNQGSDLGPLHWEHRVLATGSPGVSKLLVCVCVCECVCASNPSGRCSYV